MGGVVGSCLAHATAAPTVIASHSGRQVISAGQANVAAFSCGRQSEPQASDKPVCCNTLLGSLL